MSAHDPSAQATAPAGPAGLYKSTVWIHALVEILAKRDLDQAELFHGTSVRPSQLGDNPARVPLGDWHALVYRATQLTGDAGLGLTIGTCVSENVLQIVGQLAVASGTLREALRMFERYRPLLGNSGGYELIEEGERAYLAFVPMYPHPQLPQFDAELSLSLAYRVGRRFAVRASDDAHEIWFAHARPDYAARYAEVFRCPVRFGRPRSAILFPRAYLDAQQLYANPALLELLRGGAERMLAEQGTPSLPERVRAMLRHELELGGVDLARVARLLKQDVRTLRRQLRGANSSWSLLVDEARCQIACQELRSGDLSMEALSTRLGFSAQSAFNRAFKRWTGTTPAKYRHQAGARAELKLGRHRSGA